MRDFRVLAVPSQAMATRFAYPVTLDLHGVAVLVVGAGPVAARKVAGLAAAGAQVRVVAPDVSAEMSAEAAAGHVSALERRPFRAGDLDGVRLVITATGCDVDHDVAAAATAAGIWVNAADRPDDCSFILPAVARNGSLSIAVSTDGTSPALAQRLRDDADELLDRRRRRAGRAARRAAGGAARRRGARPRTTIGTPPSTPCSAPRPRSGRLSSVQSPGARGTR